MAVVLEKTGEFRHGSGMEDTRRLKEASKYL
jgi:hypothetical protein